MVIRASVALEDLTGTCPVECCAAKGDLEELELYIFNLAFECDRFEFMISGGDRF
jgi:hypothetical protein